MSHYTPDETEIIEEEMTVLKNAVISWNMCICLKASLYFCGLVHLKRHSASLTESVSLWITA